MLCCSHFSASPVLLSNIMFQLCWHGFESLLKRCESRIPSKRTKKPSLRSNTHTSNISSRQVGATPSHCCYCDDEVIATVFVTTTSTKQCDSFSNEMLSYRQKAWWEPQLPSTPRPPTGSPQPHADAVSAGPEICDIAPEPAKRSLSIREIRQRMNSNLSRTNSLSSFGSTGSYEFEPGLKLMSGIRGSWEDLEMFIE